MKINILISLAMLVMIFSSCISRGDGYLYPNEIPSVIINNFKENFPRAKDIEWEMKGELYNVEFELGLAVDHEAWYDKSGKMVKHKEDVGIDALSQEIQNTLSNSFKDYTIDDIEKITEGTKVIFSLDLESPLKDLNIVLNNEGEILSQVTDN